MSAGPPMGDLPKVPRRERTDVGEGHCIGSTNGTGAEIFRRKV